MVDTQQKIKEYFAENLKAEAYIPTMLTYWGQVPELLRSMLVFIHGVFYEGKFKGSKLLEIGSGATVHSIASASAHFSNIVMSDYVEDNIEELKRWLRSESSLYQLLDIPAELEGYGNDFENGRKVLEARIRKNVKRVTRCDVLTDGILLEESNDPETAPPFDMIISCLTLEVAPKDLDGYFDIFKRINTILRPGGGLLACGFIQGVYWKVGDKEFHHIKINEDDIQNALTQAGFINIDLKTFISSSTSNIEYKFKKLYCVVAEKKHIFPFRISE